MTQAILNREQSRRLDRRAQDEFAIPGIVLMENAGRGVTDKLVELGARGPVVIACGKGNNAGDGFVVARHLELRGIEPRVLLWADPEKLQGDAAANFVVLQRSGVAIEVFGASADPASLAVQLDGADWIVDALLGTGTQGAPRPPLDAVIQQLNDHAAPILAVDLSSGMDADSGQASPHTIRAAHTCTFVAHKPGFLASGAGEFTGEVHVLDIGAPRCLVEEMLREASSSDDA